MSGEVPDPGWYPCPSGLPQQRYWDGRSWSQRVRPLTTDDPAPTDGPGPGEAPPPPRDEPPTGPGAWPGAPPRPRAPDPGRPKPPPSWRGGPRPPGLSFDAGAKSSRPAVRPPDAAAPMRSAPVGRSVGAASDGTVPGRFDTAPARVVTPPAPPPRRGGGVRPLLALAPVAVAAAAIVALVAYGLNLLWPVWGAIVPVVAWWAPAPLLSARSVRRFIARTWYGCREPTREETQRLEVPWTGVLRRAGVDPGRFHLMVVESDDLNAYASDGDIVTVTSLAVRKLPARRLEAVLAHELGHHLRRHLIPALLLTQLLLPVRLLWGLTRAVWWPVRRMYRVAVIWRTPFGYLVTGLLAIVAAVAFVIFAVPAAVAYGGAALSGLGRDRAELEADAEAVRLGLGEPLLAVIEEFITSGEQAEHRRVLRTPLILRRARRIHVLLAEHGE